MIPADNKNIIKAVVITQLIIDNNNSTIIVYTQNKAEEAITHAIKLRKQGIFVEMILKDELNSKEDYSNYAHQHHINKVEFMED